MTTPWWLITLGGLLGSAHCVGMCGGFALLVGLNRGSWSQNLRAQLIYSLGRIVTYGTLGGIAGFAGRTLSDRASELANVPAWLSLAAGLFLVWEGLRAAGWLPNVVVGKSTAGCLMGPLFAAWLKHPALRNTFCAGVLTGWLPCGLVYAFVSLAAASGDLIQGLTIMLAFGLGTVPLMVLTGVGGAMLSLSVRQQLWRVAAGAVIVTGALTAGRGVSFLRAGDRPPAQRCPLCTTNNQPTETTGQELRSSP
jgi:sulfite exporter TauE/SafE